MAMLTILVTIFVLSFNVISGRILVYNTENGPSHEKFDCVYHVYDNGDEIPYCRRIGVPITLNRTEARCQNDALAFSFRNLIAQNIQPNDVLNWSSSVELADMYARFFYNQSLIDENDQYICNCTKRGTFGKYCEYQLTHDTQSFSDAIRAQFEEKRTGDSWNTQKYGEIVCYATLMCDSGPLCLDWRDINDGMQRCSGGYDEENWDKLEFNECEDNEFRCTNGMCIPEEFWLDGHVDCMDWSDELDRGSGTSCSFTPNTMECDEHICPHDSYSCGDGQCIDWLTRMAFQRFVPAKDDCFNKRNLNYMCEISPHRHAWTLPNGLCWPDRGYDDPRYPSWNMINASTLSASEKCQYLLRCALSDGFEHDCPCSGLNCTRIMADVCPSVLIYPPKRLINPNVLFYYNSDRSQESPTVGGVLFVGSHRCRGYEININESIGVPYSLGSIMYSDVNNILCTLSDHSVGYKNHSSILQYDEFCYNDSRTFNGRPYAVNPDMCHTAGECISQYRIHDGVVNCFDGDDELRNIGKDYCTGNVGQHRFQCFNNENKCLPLSELGTGQSQCSNTYDEMWYGLGSLLKDRIKCQEKNTGDCDLLKEYIRQSSVKNSGNHVSLSHSQQPTPINQISFRSYCDSFWDLYGHSDELPSMCQHYWVCQENQYQCQTGQCIELDWVCDGEWDCSDASDEEAIVLNKHWSSHNTHLIGLNSLVDKCRKRNSSLPFSSLCNTSSEFGCYLSGVSNPLDMMMNRPCISLTQIGDGIEDCYNAYDEKNTFETIPNTGSMWGFHLRCGNHSKSYSQACLSEEKNNCTKVLCLNHRSENDSCSGINDAMCLDGQCKKNARCNGTLDCLYGEDEYWCPSRLLANNFEYRDNKKRAYKPDNLHLIPQFPHYNTPVTHQKQLSNPIVNARNNNFSTMFSYVCNRGVAVLQGNATICLCPPAYYGDRCQFHSDRISIIAHIDQKTLPMSTLRIKAKFLFEDMIIDQHEFTVIPTIEAREKIKHKFYLLYSRSIQMVDHKRRRYFNRSDVINNHPYSVHFDVFSLEKENSVVELGSWHYPIYFDYLPAYRLAVVLKFPAWLFNNTGHPCSQNICNQNSICLPILNQNNSYYCSCKTGFFGKYCETRHETYCSANALYQNSSNGSPSHCICALNHFGPRCNLKHNDCDLNPCLNNGSCLSTEDHSGEVPYTCSCSKRFYGDRCQYEMGSVHIDLNMKNTCSIRTTVVQLYDIETPSFQLLIRHQQIYHAVPSNIGYYHSDVYAPSIGLLKTYENLTHPRYFIMYVLPQTSKINITSSPQYCPHVSKLLSNDNNGSVPLVFKYHQLCRNNTNLFCFHDETYMCICQSDHYRVECFRHDTQLDHCNKCLSGGKCLQGDLKDPNDFICFCPPSAYGPRCEFSSEQFNTTTGTFPVNTTTKSSLGNALKAEEKSYIILLIFVSGLLKDLHLFSYT